MKNIIKNSFNKIKDKITKTDLQRKLKEATSNEHCHANVSLLDEISSKTSNYADYQVIVSHCLKRLETKKEKWRKILKTLFLIEHILKTGSPNFVDSMKSDLYKLKNLNSFSFIDTNRSDKGETIREKSKVIVNLLENKNLLKQERDNYSRWKSRIEGVSSSGTTGSVSYASYGSNSVSSSSYSNNTSSKSYLDRDNDEKGKKKKKDVSSSSSEEDNKKKEDSQSSDEEKNNKIKENTNNEINENKKGNGNTGIGNPTTKANFSIKKPGNNQQPNNSNNNGIISNQTNQNNIGFDEIFGGNSKSISQNTNINNHNNVNNNVFNEIFSEPNNIKNTPSTNVIDLSNVSGSGNSNQQFISVPDDHHPKVDTQKLLNDMYGKSSSTNTTNDIKSNQFNFNNSQVPFNVPQYPFSGNQYTPNPYMGMSGQMNYGQYPSYTGGQVNYGQISYPQVNYGQNINQQPNSYFNFQNQNFNNNYKPEIKNNLPSSSLTTASKINSNKNSNHDDEFKEVEEDDSFKIVNSVGGSKTKSGLSNLLDNTKLVNLNDLKLGNNNSSNKNKNNFYIN